jgi:hypothetical protein
MSPLKTTLAFRCEGGFFIFAAEAIKSVSHREQHVAIHVFEAGKWLFAAN